MAVISAISFAAIIIFGFILGWCASNILYGRKSCDECLIAMIRGKKCADCPEIRKALEERNGSSTGTEKV